jgi:release factor glutamine methyltransferase
MTVEDPEEVHVEAVYARGRTTFMGLTLRVERGALVPRTETEILCRAALEKLSWRSGPGSPGPMHVVDMCCGSGNLACAIAAYEPRARVWASDLTDACARVARANVVHLGVGDRVSVHQGDLFAALAGEVAEESVDLVVCNPPYISTHRLHNDRKRLLAREPREAFDGGAYGLTMHQRVIARSLPFLKPNGWLLFEVGVGQARQVERLFERSRSFGSCEARSDAAGNVRVVLAQKNRPTPEPLPRPS